MSHEIKHADVIPDGLFVTLKDGRVALFDEQELIDCAEQSHAFAHAEEARARAAEDEATEEEAATGFGQP